MAGNKNNIQHELNKKKHEIIFAPEAKVLLVDDNEFDLRITSGMLNLSKIDAVKVFSGAEAIEMVKKYDYDIILMDHMMPGMNGVETTNAIRSLGGKYETLKIIVLTTNPVSGAKEMYLANSVDGFLPKPIGINDINELLIKHLPPEKIVHELDELGYCKEHYPHLHNKLHNLNKQLSVVFEVDKTSHSGSQAIIASLKEIPGLDVENGLNRVVKESIYLNMVEMLSKKMAGESTKLLSLLIKEDLEDFRIAVHGLKSVLASVGAVAVTERANELEKAAREEDIETCLEIFPAFFVELQELDNKLGAIFPVPVNNGEKGDFAFLGKCVEKALDAMEKQDIGGCEDIMEEVFNNDFGDKVNKLLGNLKTALEDYNFDAVKECLTKLNLS